MKRWIRVDVKLPEKKGRYLVYHYYVDSIEVICWDGKSWDWGYNVTHWMELPERPQDWVSVLIRDGRAIEAPVNKC